MSKYELNQSLAALSFLVAYLLGVELEPKLPDGWLGFIAMAGVIVVIVLAWLIERKGE